MWSLSFASQVPNTDKCTKLLSRTTGLEISCDALYEVVEHQNVQEKRYAIFEWPFTFITGKRKKALLNIGEFK